MLCAGAYTAGDFKLIGAYPGKLLNFGYFPQTFYYEDVHEKRKSGETVKLLWVSRMIGWKHPDLAVSLAKRLKDAQIKFSLTMVGNGELQDDVLKSIRDNGLDNDIRHITSLSPNEIRELMLESDIFMLTSDNLEGWGAVINEAMNSGCAVVASHKTGAAPMLITDKVNGMLFKSGNIDSLYDKVSTLCKEQELRLRLGTEAYKTITQTWNATAAAKRIMEFINDKERNVKRYSDGPLSEGKALTFGKVEKTIDRK